MSKKCVNGHLNKHLIDQLESSLIDSFVYEFSKDCVVSRRVVK